MPRSATVALDTSNCETEPLRYPGAVQPHGVLLVLQASTGIVEAASETCENFLGADAESLMGRPISHILGNAVQIALLGVPPAGLQPLVPLSLHGRELRARPSMNEARQVLVDIEAEADDFSSMRGTVYHRRDVLKTLRMLNEIPAIADRSADLIRAMTGYDRVMVYRFDAEWNGEVIAEARLDGITPYLGLNFPATDIPKQARELLAARSARLIPDVLYTPSALIARDRRPIDLGASGLRSVSATHLEYLRNMEVRATLVGSLIVDGRLWGLISCQQKNAPKYFGPSVRDALGWMFEDIAAVIDATQIRLSRSREYGLGVRRRHLVDAVRQSDLRALIQPAQSADLLEAVAADGFALITRDSIQTTGSTPSMERIRTLQARRRSCETTPTLFASSALASELQLEDAGDSVAGALFVSLRDDPQVTMIWFRNERNAAVNWGGDPARMRIADEMGRFSPRKSFEQFTQAVRGQSVAWSPEELDSAAELGSLIEIESLREREAFSQTILNSTPLLVAVLDTQGLIVSVNDPWTRFVDDNLPPMGAADSVGSSYERFIEAAAAKPSGEDAVRAWAGIEAVLHKTLPNFTLEYPCHSFDTNRWFRMTAFPIRAPGEGGIVALEDISERKHLDLELEQYRDHLEKLVDERTAALETANEAAAAAHRTSVERLNAERETKIQSSKLEAMGTLAAGIAHDFNNILASVIAYAELAEDDLTDRLEAKDNVAKVISGCFRARDLVIRMLDFARERPGDIMAVNVAVQISEALALLRSSLRPSIELAFQSSLTAGTTTIQADPTQIMQIVMNLCINAAHAMDNHGVIGIRAEPAASIKDAPPDQRDGVCITVADTGSGMTPDVMERMFDPFFTTKAPGEGSGLGLSVVYSIVKNMGGFVKARSSAVFSSSGTQIQVFLPCSQQSDVEGAA